jgi:hypothetical protein
VKKKKQEQKKADRNSLNNVHTTSVFPVIICKAKQSGISGIRLSRHALLYHDSKCIVKGRAATSNAAANHQYGGKKSMPHLALETV